MEERKAKCVYYGKIKPKRSYANDECNYICYGKDYCECVVESSDNLPFFEEQKDKEFDKFYCGCHGWD